MNDNVPNTLNTPAPQSDDEQPREQREADGVGNDDATAQMPIVGAGTGATLDHAIAGMEARGVAEAAEAAEATGALMPRLVALVELGGHDDGRVTPITRETAVIGRHHDDLTLALPHDLWVSRRHAQLTYHDGRWWIKDLNSSNGTWLDAVNRPVHDEEPLALEVVFRVGHTDLMLTADPDVIVQGASDGDAPTA